MSKMTEELQEGISRLSAENTRVKELNREMVAMIERLAEHLENCYDREIEDTIEARELLAKTEEGEGE